MKLTLSVLTAALFAGALAVPAMAQSGGDANSKQETNVTAPAPAGEGGAMTNSVEKPEVKTAQSEQKTEEKAEKATEEKSASAEGKAATKPHAKHKGHHGHKSTKNTEAGSAPATGGSSTGAGSETKTK